MFILQCPIRKNMVAYEQRPSVTNQIISTPKTYVRPIRLYLAYATVSKIMRRCYKGFSKREHMHVVGNNGGWYHLGAIGPNHRGKIHDSISRHHGTSRQIRET